MELDKLIKVLHYWVVMISAVMIFFLVGANSTLSAKQKTECVKWNESDVDYCPRGQYNCDSEPVYVGQGQNLRKREGRNLICCRSCPEGKFMSWFNTCSECFSFTVCEEGQEIRYGGDYMNDRVCGDFIQSTTDPGHPRSTQVINHGSSTSPHDPPYDSSSDNDDPPVKGRPCGRTNDITLAVVIVISFILSLITIGCLIQMKSMTTSTNGRSQDAGPVPTKPSTEFTPMIQTDSTEMTQTDNEKELSGVTNT